MNSEERLADARQRIDAIDGELLRLLSARAACAGEVAEIKAELGDTQFYRPGREAEVLRRIKARNPGPLSGEAMARLFREIMSACLALEQPLSVAFLGPPGTFTQAAAVKHFGHAATTVPVATINDVFREVEARSCHYGVVPVENSTEGVINHTLDMFMRSPLSIAGEVSLRINHHLMSREPELAAIQVLYSHQQSLAQCRGWLDRHLPLVERIAVDSNAEAARMAANHPGAAAVAGEAAADIYDLDILERCIEDEPGNTTRFLVIGTEDARPSGEDKTSLLISAHNEAGSLHALLEPFATHGISMSRIESRPSRRGLWDYVFFVDIDGHREDPQVAPALESLRRASSLFRILGSYPKAVI